MNAAIEELLQRIAEVGSGLHSAGTLSTRALAAIGRAAQQRRLRHSAETGSGSSTLLLSHLSDRHIVFALDGGSGSVTNIQRSPLLRKSTVTFVEGPTQSTLPRFQFTEKLQLVLIDGPHAYPFPDLEYYFLYPHLDPGGLLILDDIHIPTVNHLFQFLRRDAMFRLDEVVDTTALFTRTDAPAFDPLGDGWSNQNYNAKPLSHYTWRENLKKVLPGPFQRRLMRLKSARYRGRTRGSVEIHTPPAGAPVSERGAVAGSATLPDDLYLWVLVRRHDVVGWWPQGEQAVPVSRKQWSVSVKYGEPTDAGFDFEIAALLVGQATHDLWTDWVARARETGRYPPVQLPSAQFIGAEAYRTVTHIEQ